MILLINRFILSICCYFCIIQKREKIFSNESEPYVSPDTDEVRELPSTDNLTGTGHHRIKMVSTFSWTLKVFLLCTSMHSIPVLLPIPKKATLILHDR